MRWAGRIIGVMLALFFVLSVPFALWTFNTQRYLLESSTYKTLFVNEDFYDKLLPRVLPALLTDLEPTNADPHSVSFLEAVNHLSTRDWREIAPLLVPPAWVKSEVEGNMDAFLAWLEDDAPLEIVFHTDAVRRQMESPSGADAVLRMTAALPACSAEEQAAFERYVAGDAQTPFPYCRPNSEALIRELHRLLNEARLAAAQGIPPQLDVIEEMRVAAQEMAQAEGEPLEGDPFSPRELNKFRASVKLWRKLLPLALLIPLALLSLLVIVLIRSAKAFFRWTGWLCILGGLLALTPLYLLPFIVPTLGYEQRLASGFATGGALIAEVVGQRMAELLIGAFTWPILFQASLLVGIGFMFVVLSVFLRPPEPEFAVPWPPEPVATSGGSTAQPIKTPTGYYVYQPPQGQATAPSAPQKKDNPS